MRGISATCLRSPRLARAAICVFFAAFLLLGFLTVPDYGQPADEKVEISILRMNLWEYARVLGTDESSFEKIAAENPLFTPISQSRERDHGMSAFYPMAPVVMSESLSENARMLLWHGYCWALFTLGAFALYACCRALDLPRSIGLLAVLFLLLSPRFFAEGHYNNKDIVLLSMTLCVLWQGLAFMRRPTFSRGICFAFFGALAAGTKVAGLALWGLCALFVLFRQLAARKLRGRVIWVGLVTPCAFSLFYALLSPVFLQGPADFLRYLVDNAVNYGYWSGDILFRGEIVNPVKTGLPWCYLPYLIYATTPLWLLLMIAVGQVGALAACRPRALFKGRERPLGLLLCTLMWALPLGYAVVSHTKVYNGWRHFYFIYGPLLVLAAYGVYALWGRLRAKGGLRRAFALALSLCMLFTGVGEIGQHPYQFAYYQPLTRLHGEGYMETDYWNVSAVSALKRLAAETEGPIRLGYVDTASRYCVTYGVEVLPPELAERFIIVEDAASAPYLLENTTYSVYSGFAPAPDMREMFTLTSYGQAIMRVYERVDAAAK